MVPQLLLVAGARGGDVVAGAGALGAVHGVIGGAEEGVDGIGGDGVGNADAGGDARLVDTDVDGRGQGGEGLPGKMLGDGGGGGGIEEDREFVAAEAGGGGCGTEAVLQAAGGGDEEEVAREVAEVIIDLLEAIEIDEEDGDAGTGAAGTRLCEGTIEALKEKGAVG